MKKCLIVSLMLLSLLTLAACGTTQGDTTDSSQTAADTTQDAQDTAQNDAQGDTQENAQNDTQEGSKNDGKIDSKTDGKIKPLPDALDLNRLTSGTVAASFDASSLKEVGGQLQLSFTVYNYEKFDAADISGLKAGDVLVVSGQEMTVASVQASDGYVTVNGGEPRKTGPGLVILLGVRDTDDSAIVPKLAEKCAHLRIFEDENGKLNRSAVELGYSALVVSNFTLYGDTAKGKRPSFIHAAKGELAVPCYEKFLEEMGHQGLKDVQHGEFGADMKIDLVNDGPVTIVIDTDEWKK